MFGVLCFDIAAIAILAILLFSLEFRTPSPDNAGKRLIAIIVYALFGAIFDILTNVFNGQLSMVYVNYLCTGILFVLRSIAFYEYAMYITAITGVGRKSTGSYLNLIRYVPMFLMALFVVCAPYTGHFYYFDSNGFYVRGPWFIVLYMCSAEYALYGFYYVVKWADIIGIRKALSLSSCALFSFLASAIQLYNKDCVIEILGFVLSILFIVLFIENPGDKIETSTHLIGWTGFVRELKMSFYSNRPVDIIHADISNFKIIEEMLSYNNMLALARKIGVIVKTICFEHRVDGAAYYINGGKIRIVLNKNNLKRTTEIAKIMLDTFDTEIAVNDISIGVELSICITQCPKDFNLFDDLAAFGKVAGGFQKTGEIIYTSEILKSSDYGLQANINKLLENGIVNDRFEVMYQPIYSVENKSFTEVEAKLRIHGDNEYIGQDEFWHAAEQSGLITEIGNYTLTEVCKFISGEDFRKTGINKVNITLSTFECLQSNFADRTRKTLEKYGVSPEMIRFEIVESSVSDNQKSFEDNIKELSGDGFSFVLDKYGVEYSNIITLSSLPLDVIRFDMSLVKNWNSERVRGIFNNSIEMVKSLGKRVVIDGIEKTDDVEYFEKADCEYLQGTFFAHPMDFKRLIGFYNENPGH